METISPGDILSYDAIMNKALASTLHIMFEGAEDITASIHKRQRRELSDAASSSGGVLHLSGPIADVTVTSDQLKHFRDTLVRADGAISHGKTRCLELARTLHNEQIAVRDAIVTVDRLARGE